MVEITYRGRVIKAVLHREGFEVLTEHGYTSADGVKAYSVLKKHHSDKQSRSIQNRKKRRMEKNSDKNLADID